MRRLQRRLNTTRNETSRHYSRIAQDSKGGPITVDTPKIKVAATHQTSTISTNATSKHPRGVKAANTVGPHIQTRTTTLTRLSATNPIDDSQSATIKTDSQAATVAATISVPTSRDQDPTQ